MATGPMTFEALKKLVKSGEIDTVIAAFPDMQGRLMGKRFEANFFVDGAYEETHGCNYLLAVDVDMEPVPGYKSASWEKGYGDYVIKPDLGTIRPCPWLPKTALVLSDLLDHHTHELVPYAPRSVLKKQLERLAKLKMKAYMASELEFYVFDQSFKEAHAGGYRTLTTPSHLNEDYNLLQTTKDENLMRAIRNGLYGAGITVENSKGEA
ncbi:MAG: glutamine synthetase, partial [Phyllobacteriaceae bacterium]|nr:glutamine synthetase [Phyllobacteriaceae bacterium]